MRASSDTTNRQWIKNFDVLRSNEDCAIAVWIQSILSKYPIAYKHEIWKVEIRSSLGAPGPTFSAVCFVYPIQESWKLPSFKLIIFLLS